MAKCQMPQHDSSQWQCILQRGSPRVFAAWVRVFLKLPPLFLGWLENHHFGGPPQTMGTSTWAIALCSFFWLLSVVGLDLECHAVGPSVEF